MFETMILCNVGKHRYTLASTGLRMKSGEYTSRQAAEYDMYRIMNKKGLHVEEVYNDRHFKTYVCNHGVRFYINRI